jgi:hypothetical protein
MTDKFDKIVLKTVCPNPNQFPIHCLQDCRDFIGIELPSYNLLNPMKNKKLPAEEN